MKTIEFFLGYYCSPIWLRESDDNICNPIELEEAQTRNFIQNEYLIKEIEEVDNMFQDTFNTYYPPEPLHEDTMREYIFINRVLVCAKLLEKELIGKCEFIFDWKHWENEKKKLEKILNLSPTPKKLSLIQHLWKF